MPVAIEIPERHGLKNLKPGRGRRWGSRSKIPIDLKRAAIAAAEAYGCDGKGANGLTGYLFMLADRHPKAFSMLLAKLLPLQIDSILQAAVGEVRIVSIPAGTFLAPEAMAKVIEHETSIEQPIKPE